MYDTFENFAGDKGFGPLGRLAYNNHAYGSTGYLRESLLKMVDDEEFVVVHKAFMEYVAALVTAAGCAVVEKGDVISKVLSTVRHSRMDPVIYLTGTLAFVTSDKAVVMYAQTVACEVTALSVTPGTGLVTPDVPKVKSQSEMRAAPLEVVSGEEPSKGVKIWDYEDKDDDSRQESNGYVGFQVAQIVSADAENDPVGCSGGELLHGDFWKTRRDAMARVSGYCFLAMFKPQCIETVTRELAASPRLAAILAYDDSYYDFDSWASLYVVKQRGNVLHLSTAGTWPLMNVVSSFIAGHPTVGPYLRHLVSYVVPGTPVFPGGTTMGILDTTYVRANVSALRERNTVLVVQGTPDHIDVSRAKPQRLFATARASSSETKTCVFHYKLPNGSPRFLLLKPSVYVTTDGGTQIGSASESTVYYISGESVDICINLETDRVYGLGYETTVQQFEDRLPLWTFQFDFLPFWARQIYNSAHWPMGSKDVAVVLHTPTTDDLVKGADIAIVDTSTYQQGCVKRTGGITGTVLGVPFKTYPHVCRVSASIDGNQSGVYYGTSLKLNGDDTVILALGGQETVCMTLAPLKSKWNTSVEEVLATPVSVVKTFWSRF